VTFNFITILFIHPKILSFFFTERIHKYTDDRAQQVKDKKADYYSQKYPYSVSLRNKDAS
jgi:hypothetical protein